MEKNNVERINKLTAAQEGILFQILSNEYHPKYSVQRLYKSKIPLDTEKCQSILDKLTHMYSALRTVIIYKDVKQPVAVTLKSIKNKINFFTVGNSEELKKTCKQRHLKKFDIQIESAVRMDIIKNNADYYLCLTTNHLLVDGKSFDNLILSFMKLYSNEILNIKLADNIFSAYSDFYNSVKKENQDYWNEKVSKIESDYHLSDVFSEKSERSEWLHQSINLKGTQFDKLKQLSSSWNVTLNNILEYLWGITQSRLSLSKNILFARATSGRSWGLDSVDNEIGNFVNIVPVIFNVNYESKIKESVVTFNSESLNDNIHQFCSFSDIVKVSPTNNFGSLVVNNNYSEKTTGYFLEQKYEREENEFPLHFVISTYKDSIDITLNYSTNEFSSNFVNHLIKLYEECLDILLNSEEGEITDSFFFKENQQDVINNKSIMLPVDRFQILANKYPEKIAVVEKENKVTYAELLKKSQKIATYIQWKYGEKLENKVIVLGMKKSIDLIIAMYGCWLIGAACFILDPSVPNDRSKKILSDLNPLCVLSMMDITKILESKNLIDKTYKNVKVDPNSICTYIYTSGSTGNPKGVKISFDNLANFTLLNNENTIVRENDIKNRTMLSLTSTSFDIFQNEIHVPLTNLGTVVIPDENNIIESIIKTDILQTTPSKFQYVFDTVEKKEYLNSVSLIILAGEKLSSKLVKEIRKYTKADIINGYGPTECTIYSSFKRIKYTDKISNLKTISIGKPYSNYQISIERDNKNCLAGTVGEIVVYGRGVGLGYQNLESDAFLKDRKGYHTGDCGLISSDGEIRIIGRIDNQVKLNGYRIELEEVEYQFNQIPEVVNAVAKLQNIDGFDYLTVYYVSEKNLDKNYIDSKLTGKLMSYMLPNYCIRISQIPTNINGKVDRDKLPQISFRSSAKIGDDNYSIIEIVKEVLNVVDLKMTDNLLSKGLTSLHSIRLVGRINKVFGIDCTISDIFYNLRVSDLCDMVSQKISNFKNNLSDKELSISEMPETQKRIYLANQKYNDTRYNLPYICNYQRGISTEQVRKVVDSICDHFKVLKMNLVFDKNGFRRVKRDIHNNKVIEIEEQSINSIKDLIQPFDISNGEAFRIFIIKSSSESTRFLFDFHHAFFDGIAVKNFFSIFSKILDNEYYLESSDIKPSLFLPNFKIESNNKDFEYWEEKQSKLCPVNIDGNYIVSENSNISDVTYSEEFSKELWASLVEYSVQMKTTPYIILMSVYAVLLYKYTGSNKISFSFPISGRETEENQDQIDVFVKSLFISVDIKNCKFYEVVNRVKKDFYESIAHPTFIPNQTIDFVFASQPSDIKIGTSNDTLIFSSISNGKSKFKFSLLFSEPGEQSGEIKIEYDTSSYSAGFVKYVMKHYLYLLKEAMEKTDSDITDLVLVNNEEKNLINQYSTTPEWTVNKDILEEINKIALKNPNKACLYFFNETITYGDLVHRITILAKNLIDNYGVKAGDRIGIFLDRGPDIIISMLAILYSGGCYVPLSKEDPEERLSFIEKDSDLSIIISDTSEATHLFETTIVNKNNIDFNKEYEYAPLKIDEETSAYIIYTSGTTGVPKGVEISRKNLRNFYQDNRILCLLNKVCDNVLFLNDFIFDITVQEIYLPLIKGIPVIISKDTRETPDFHKFRNIGIFSTPSRLELLDEKIFDVTSMIMMGGEKFNVGLYKRITNRNNKVVFINGYGPTEATVGCVYYQLDTQTNLKKRIPIGRPLEGYEVRIVDQKLKDTGIGIIGELIVSGKGIAKGYVNRPDLSAKVFIELNGKRYYKTGDLCRWNSDGNIEFIGRSDKQVKLNGHRIELSEIEQILLTLPGITQSKVIWDEKNASLAAYMISNNNLDLYAIMKSLEKRLPNYMVPRRYAQIDEFPIKTTGKLDISKLPNAKIVSNTLMSPPVSETDKAVVEIISDVLNIPANNISMSDNIFDMGAQSILVLKMIREIEKGTGKLLKISSIFKNPRVEEISQMIEYATKSDFKHLTHQELSIAPMTNAQVRMLYLSESMGGLTYNVPFLYSNSTPICSDKIRKVFESIINNHVEYRTAFKIKREGFFQEVVNDYDVDFKDLGEIIQSPIEFSKNLIQPFNLKLGNTIRMRIFNFRGEQFIFLDSHHIVSDEQSMKIFWNEFIAGLLGEKIIRSNLTYLDYSTYIDKLDFSPSEIFWQNEMLKIEQAVKVIKKVITEDNSYFEKNIKVRRNEIYTPVPNLTSASYFQTLFAISMSIYHNCDQITIGIPVSGRAIPETDSIIGLFTNTLPIIYDFEQKNISLLDVINRENEHLLSCMEHQLYPFNKIVELGHVIPTAKGNPLFNIFYSYHAKEDSFKRIKKKELLLNMIPLHDLTPKFGASLTVYEEQDEFTFQFEFLESFYDKAATETIVNIFNKVCKIAKFNKETEILEDIKNDIK